MNEADVLQDVLTKLEECEIDYMVTGSQASSVYGSARTTKDADIVIRTHEPSLKRFMSLLQGVYFADIDMAIDALRTTFMFNVIHYETGFKIDFIFAKQDEYSNTAIERRVQRNLFGKNHWIVSPEDSILSKLVWSKESGSERHIEDVIGIVKIQLSTLDMTYMKQWSLKLGVDAMLNRILSTIQQDK